MGLESEQKPTKIAISASAIAIYFLQNRVPLVNPHSPKLRMSNEVHKTNNVYRQSAQTSIVNLELQTIVL